MRRESFSEITRPSFVPLYACLCGVLCNPSGAGMSVTRGGQELVCLSQHSVLLGSTDWRGSLLLEQGRDLSVCPSTAFCLAPQTGEVPCCWSLSLPARTGPWPESAGKLYRPRDRRLSEKLVEIFADKGCRVVSVTDPYGRILGFPDRSRYFFFQVNPQLYSRG
jgi:hypothetical protein